MHMMAIALMLFASLIHASWCSSVSICSERSECSEKHELYEMEATKMELLQDRKLARGDVKAGRGAINGITAEGKGLSDSDPNGEIKEEGRIAPGQAAIAGDRHYLLVRPCARWAGDGMSGLPRHRVTSECCGDNVCSPERWEEVDTCPQDCKAETNLGGASDDTTRKKTIGGSQSTLFGELEDMEHDEYHCEGEYENETTEDGTPCSGRVNEDKHKVWISDLLSRAQAKTLPFDWPAPGSVAVEFGCGLGQDSRNLAEMAGFEVTAVDVSPAAIEHAKNFTSPELLGSGPGKIEFVAYDSLALPVPKKRIDYFFDATVYCSLRHSRLSRIYDVLSRIATPGHTLVNFQCWSWEEYVGTHPVLRARRDMEADFEPFFDVLHSEDCAKNQGAGPGWCFYLKMKPAEVRDQILEDRLKIQHAARDGDVAFARKYFEKRSGNVPESELMTLTEIADDNMQTRFVDYLVSNTPHKEDPFFETVYGNDALQDTVDADDRFDGGASVKASAKVKYLKANWERLEAELVFSK